MTETEKSGMSGLATSMQIKESNVTSQDKE